MVGRSRFHVFQLNIIIVQQELVESSCHFLNADHSLFHIWPHDPPITKHPRVQSLDVIHQASLSFEQVFHVKVECRLKVALE